LRSTGHARDFMSSCNGERKEKKDGQGEKNAKTVKVFYLRLPDRLWGGLIC